MHYSFARILEELAVTCDLDEIIIPNKIRRKPPNSLNVTGSYSIHAPNKIAVTGFKPVAIAACVGEMLLMLFPITKTSGFLPELPELRR